MSTEVSCQHWIWPSTPIPRNHHRITTWSFWTPFLIAHSHDHSHVQLTTYYTHLESHTHKYPRHSERNLCVALSGSEFTSWRFQAFVFYACCLVLILFWFSILGLPLKICLMITWSKSVFWLLIWICLPVAIVPTRSCLCCLTAGLWHCQDLNFQSPHDRVNTSVVLLQSLKWYLLWTFVHR